ncbi:hypothetical protein OCU04_001107 [Sclerotinia nivalis]|uniref:Uncharacterized protein n=1 Tax=Sclerotinia nivalis TaxID=352851 RepID=A0A9X0AXG0_9HELO|nr:hypothetical protein OCU04_001107 [Sclerotinia nivalis]
MSYLTSILSKGVEQSHMHTTPPASFFHLFCRLDSTTKVTQPVEAGKYQVATIVWPRILYITDTGTTQSEHSLYKYVRRIISYSDSELVKARRNSSKFAEEVPSLSIEIPRQHSKPWCQWDNYRIHQKMSSSQ